MRKKSYFLYSEFSIVLRQCLQNGNNRTSKIMSDRIKRVQQHVDLYSSFHHVYDFLLWNLTPGELFDYFDATRLAERQRSLRECASGDDLVPRLRHLVG